MNRKVHQQDVQLKSKKKSKEIKESYATEIPVLEKPKSAFIIYCQTMKSQL